MASSSIVIKVKFGETLRRFTAAIHNEKLALDVLALRVKIRSLLNFTPDVDFTLTYLDEDGDVVTLADDDDIHDVVRQSLNPLRITVTLNNGNPSFSSGTSTPMQSPQTQFPLPPAISELLKSVPEPLRDQLTTLPLELASKATSSSPVFTELMEKMKSLLSESMAAQRTNTSLLSESMAAQRTNTSKPVVDPEAESSNSKVQKMSEGVKSVDLNLPYMEYEPFPALVTGKNKDTTDSVEKKKDSDVIFANPIDYLKQYVKESKAANTGGVLPGSNDSGNSSGWSQAMLNTTSNCPFSGIPYSMDTNVHYHHPSRGHHHWKKHSNAIGNVVFHRGVRCDGCGVHPITGPRFKSKVKEDYDLCNVCFTGMGNTSDYIRMDRPSNTMRHHMPFRGLQNLGIPTPTLPHALRAPGSKLPRSKLDSRFILDVNVLDGTIMAPFTEFTKIWRMRNNGTVIWPRGSQLQWIGGDRLSDSVSVDIEIPGDGLVVEKELDVAVDFRAPELPGRYISYWRMATSSGQKFGQRVWVLIQVDASMKDLGETSINLNLPPPVKSSPEVAVVTQDPLMDSILGGGNHEEPKDEDMNFPINDSLIIDNNGGSAATSPVVVSDNVATSPVVPPLVFGTEQVEAALASMDNVVYPTVETSEVAVPPSVVEAANEREEGLVQELVSMGFNQVELNKEILRMNNYDLEKSVDDLCGVSEWDPMLEELQEMGFADEEANRRLLKKNNGSIKRVVMDLINGEKA